MYSRGQLRAESMRRQNLFQCSKLREQRCIAGVNEGRSAEVAVNVHCVSLTVPEFLARLYPVGG